MITKKKALSIAIELVEEEIEGYEDRMDENMLREHKETILILQKLKSLESND